MNDLGERTRFSTCIDSNRLIGRARTVRLVGCKRSSEDVCLRGHGLENDERGDHSFRAGRRDARRGRDGTARRERRPTPRAVALHNTQEALEREQ